jgi:hypothetical protein
MTFGRITPRALKTGLLVQSASWLALELTNRLAPDSRLGLAQLIITALGGALAYGLALKLNLEVAAEYRNVRWLRLAWLMLAANAGLSLLRPILMQGIQPLAGDLRTRELFGLLNHLLVVPANLSLLVGVLALWWAYHEVGLGNRVKARDYALMAGFLGVMLSILLLREGLTEARSTYPFAAQLQLLGLGIISIATALSIALHRLAQQMGGSQLAASLRWLVAYLWLRNLLVLAATATMFLGPEEVFARRALGYFQALCWPAVPWLLALAAACRAELTASAARELQQRRAARNAPDWRAMPGQKIKA